MKKIHLKIINTREQVFVVALGAQLEDRAAEQVELHRHLGRHGGINNGGQLVGGEYSERVVPEVQDGDELVVADALEAPQRQVPLLF